MVKGIRSFQGKERRKVRRAYKESFDTRYPPRRDRPRLEKPNKYKENYLEDNDIDS